MEHASAGKDKSTSSSATDAIEQRVMAFAEQLGRAIGSIQAKTDGLVDLAAVQEQMTRIRDGAAGLLDQLGGGQPAGSPKPRAKTAARRTTTARPTATKTAGSARTAKGGAKRSASAKKSGKSGGSRGRGGKMKRG